MGVMEHADYTDFCQFAREQYEQQPCSATRLLMSTPDLVELLMYLSLISHTKKLGSDGIGVLKMILSHINLSMGNVILKTVGKILLTVQELHKSGVTVPDEFVLLPYSMLEVLPMVFSEPRVKVYSKIYRRKLIGYMKPEVQKVIRNQ